ncbi:hypothetical protein SAMN03159341_109112 [Paenibacillus sp. 1_12]|uniref:hypothetical protein n=1 Tax=Paenibacillus sp. 1_12 TaxID=1566278 RepID=UPI0008E4BD46|nr:hypothetical protein [Paenibacillus sp. 1_12]SFL74504.1 hypothetical protein SAMN03159341_109112 [Paenibacillus sp. 1_12]
MKQSKLVLSVMAALLFLCSCFSPQAYAQFKSAILNKPNTVQTGSGIFFKLNLLGGTTVRPEQTVTKATYGVNRSLAIDFGKKKAASGSMGILTNTIDIQNKGGLLLLVVTAIDDTSPTAGSGITKFLSVLNLNLSLGSGTTSSVGLGYNPVLAALMPKGVYTGFVIVTVVLTGESFKVPISIELY